MYVCILEMYVLHTVYTYIHTHKLKYFELFTLEQLHYLTKTYKNRTNHVIDVTLFKPLQ